MSGAVVILSGGLDSSTCLGIAKSTDRDPLYALSFRYGQRHFRELIAARKVAAFYQVEHFLMDLPFLSGSALTDASILLPLDRGLKDMAAQIPVTYVPGRNLIFLALAASFAEAHDCSTIYFGANALDYSGYSDCRPEFVKAVERVVQVGTKSGTEGEQVWRVITPLMYLGKKSIIEWGLELKVPYHLTYSCYTGEEVPCGRCDSCRLRAAGFAELGVPDPALTPSQTS